ncbi:MAG: GIY-YIG nuclease family protein [Spirochaetales bacterium]|nr:GIY-YIG nuclease family protein [Spirochaetales bacterium]
MEKKKLYWLYNPLTKLHKIGSSDDVEFRVSKLEPANGTDLFLICTLESKCSYQLEKLIHKALENVRERGEWFSITLIDLFLLKNILNKITSGYIHTHKDGSKTRYRYFEIGELQWTDFSKKYFQSFEDELLNFFELLNEQNILKDKIESRILKEETETDMDFDSLKNMLNSVNEDLGKMNTLK